MWNYTIFLCLLLLCAPNNISYANPLRSPSDFGNPVEHIAPIPPKRNKLSVKSYRKQCDNFKGFACFRVAIKYHVGHGVQRNRKKALSFAKKSCLLREKRGCSLAGYLARPKKKALRWYRRACQLNYNIGCVNAGISHYMGHGVQRSKTLALTYLKKACRLGSAIGCIHVSLIYTTGKSATKNKVLTQEYRLKACRLDPKSCKRLTQYFQQMVRKKRPKPQALRRLKQKATCLKKYLRLNNQAMVIGGSKAPLHRKRQSRPLLEKACNGRCGMACFNLGIMYDRTPQFPNHRQQSIRLLEKGCLLHFAKACRFAGQLMQYGSLKTRNNRRALKFYRKGCTLGNPASCNQLAAYYKHGRIVQRDHKKMIQLLHKACRYGSLTACQNLGAIYFMGIGVPVNRPKAFQMVQRACRRGHRSSCAQLGILHYNGHATPRNEELALAILRKSCTRSRVPNSRHRRMNQHAPRKFVLKEESSLNSLRFRRERNPPRYSYFRFRRPKKCYMIHTIAIDLSICQGKLKQAKEQIRRWLPRAPSIEQRRLRTILQRLRTSSWKQQPSGVWIGRVFANTAASRAGLQQGDILLSYAGHKLESSGQMTRLKHLVKSPTRKLVILRGQQILHKAIPAGPIGISPYTMPRSSCPLQKN